MRQEKPLSLAVVKNLSCRQMSTRNSSSHQVTGRLVSLLTAYFDADDLIEKDLPRVEDLAGRLQVSAAYLANLLKTHTDHTTQHYIPEKGIAKASASAKLPVR